VVRVECTHCKRRYRTEVSAFGKVAVCTCCHKSFKIGASRPSFEWQQADLAEDSWIGVAPPAEEKEYKHCFNCEAPLEEGQVTCPECGISQITGLVRRRKAEPENRKKSIWLLIPVGKIVVAAVVLGVVLGIYFGIQALYNSAVDVGEQMAENVVIAEAVKHLNLGGDEYTLARTFRGQVTDANLAFYLGKLSSDNPGVRRAAGLLIGCGAITRLEPVVAAAVESDTVAVWILDAIGTRRLVELSCDDDAQVRRSAARALCLSLLFDLGPGDEMFDRLAQADSVDSKIRVLNNICRPYPEAVGTFTVTVGEDKAPFRVRVEQMGRTFYLHVGTFEFRTDYKSKRKFVIPIERWCAATGTAVDVREVRRLVGGSVVLASPMGVGWEGKIGVTIKQLPKGSLPGFLPIKSVERGQRLELPISLR